MVDLFPTDWRLPAGNTWGCERNEEGKGGTLGKKQLETGMGDEE